MDIAPRPSRILTTLRDSWRQGRTRRVLSSLDDRRLKDIGLLSGPARPESSVHEPTQRWLDSLR
jgi:uncharacterized protein YjiS (DUF1127 family)